MVTTVDLSMSLIKDVHGVHIFTEHHAVNSCVVNINLAITKRLQET